MALEARHPVSIVGDDAPLRVLARGTLVDLGAGAVRIRLDEDAELAEGRQAVIVVVHRTKVELVLGERVDREAELRMVRIARVIPAE